MHINESAIHRIQTIGHELLEMSDIHEFRNQTAHRLSRFFSASTSAFFHWADARGEAAKLERNDILFWQLPSEYQDIYFQDVFRDDPLTKWVNGRRHFGATAMSSIASQNELKTTTLYRQILQPNKQQDILLILFVVNQRLLGHISLTRHQNASLFGPEDVQLANLLAPMLSAAYSEHLTRQQYAKRDNIVDILASLFPGRFFMLLNESRELIYHSNNSDESVADSLCLQPRILESLRDKLKEPARTFTMPGHAPHHMPCWDMGFIHSPIKDQGETVSSSFRHHVIIHNGKLFHLLWLNANHDSLGDSTQASRYGLTRREMDVIVKVKEGLNSTEIGKELSISPWTVKNHLQSIYSKVGVNNRISLVKHFS